MNDVLNALRKRFEQEPYSQIFGMELVELEQGRALIKMKTSTMMNNIFASTHGAAVFSLMDAAFELAVNSHGTVAVALSVNVNYLNPINPGEILYSEGRETNRSSRISACDIQVTTDGGKLIATCQALAYRKKDPLPFL